MNEIIFPVINLKLNVSPIMFTIGRFYIYWYGFLIAVGMAVGMFLCKKNDGKFGIKFDDILGLFIYVIPISIISARLYYVLFKLDFYLKNPLKILYIRDGGLAIYGGIIGALITVILYCKNKKISIYDMIDFVVPYLALGQSIGRWGNFFNQEAHGRITNSIFRMGIWEDGNYMEVHPTFLYESVGTLAIFVLLKFLQGKRKYKGQIMYTYLASYSFIRALIEGLRTDSLMLGNFRVSQVLSIIIFAVSSFMLMYQYINNKNNTNSASEKENNNINNADKEEDMNTNNANEEDR